MIQIPSSQALPEFSDPSLPQAIRFFSSRQKKILIIASIVFLVVVILSGIGFYFWLTSFKKSRVDFNISGPTQAASGEQVTYLISYWNNTNQILQNAGLTVRYPQEAVVTGDKMVQNIDLGSIGIGGGGKIEVSLALVGSDKSIQKLQAVLSYKPQNTASTFENEAVKDVAINGSALSLNFKTPETVLPNIRNIYVIHYKNNTEKIFKNVSIEASYPQNFNFVSSDQMPAKSNNVWNLGDLNPNEEGDITVVGILRNIENANFELAIGVRESDKFFKFSRSSAQINLAVPPLQIDISVNNQPNTTVNPGDFLQFKINYKNNTSISLSDVVLKAKLDGLMYDFSSLKTKGFYSGSDNTITWNAGNTTELRNLSPTATGEVEFQINVKPRYVIRTFRDKNFLLQVLATIETSTIPSSLAVELLSVSNDLALKVNTKAELKTKGYYYDAVIKNSGPLPPKVGQTTTYTIHWQVTNYSNDLDKVIVKTVLPEGISWQSKKAGAGAATLEYNDRTSELTWNIGKLPAGTGVLLDPYEVIFQVALMPSIKNVNTIMSVIGDSNLIAEDVFTGINITAMAPTLRTDMPDDSGIGFQKGRVQP
ncbi:hypothetical protein A2819_01075 [Candidatus Azambacteria bacterium RIFCSPHIGHO2_01_FULL_40_24]|uniref:DUF11 domain-containing protein n=1 Tax=Candidatus Azambacteria bacterium RIFCSPHIGHO2_01_FULL_40_24 TaxID=1797301 RepID=A0A1F5B2G2_9BACT|nr:MAG: hypothetical protein A2819_01075 [Candidatus Azambacteria bacterium RIFCSPHIGHO2_01_FULL_40_24]